MIKQVFLLGSIFIFLQVTLPAQEVVTGLQSNHAVGKQFHIQKKKGLAASDTLILPFFDDFSGESFLPDKNKWIDDYVFINNTYSNSQITKGIATFDALDNTGRLYASSSSTGFMADQLTSKPFNLSYPSSDNIWLSFLFQAGGLSDTPELNDSLTLQFFAPDESKWYSVWKSVATPSTFKTVIIPVSQTRYLKKGFRFRFVNYASLSNNLNDPSLIGNCDIWNVDYLTLDRNRNAADTLYRDVAFRLPLRSALKNHEAMPWNQFRQIHLNEMSNPVISVAYRNNDNIVRNITRDFWIHDVYNNTQSHFFSAGATNINPLTSVDYSANLIYTFDGPDTDSALFRITSSLKTDEFDPKENDTLVYYQVFKNYFAFDDGSSEGGYGINGLGSRNAMLAYRFTSFIKDTLRAVGISFNDSYMDANKRAFDLMVWDDNNGTPGEVIYTQEGVMVEQSEIINGFYTYRIPDGIMVNGTFYVGWKQKSETFLNAGFDINTPHKGRMQYFLNGLWSQSQVQGSVMIRAFVGKSLNLTGLNDNYYTDLKKIKIWPNPAQDFITVGLSDQPYSSSSFISIIDLSGHELIRVPYADEINISSLKKGLYIVITSINGRRVGYSRLIKSR